MEALDRVADSLTDEEAGEYYWHIEGFDTWARLGLDLDLRWGLP